ncbi:M23 family metallopeptidase [Spirochaeta cellobiosiphila]|uniref:M23 family metallopeptidase n=1 Tax=Spirochaeta cellobiosiphila TaxID=504483 RepID=UPI0004148FAF|nr:M23 family metallopeptidase [Spirochaeta cellobiosiphila]
MYKWPKNLQSAEAVYDENEFGSGGYYPIGANNMWHSGIHIETKETDISNLGQEQAVYPLFDGKIVAYRISSEYKELNKPSIISDRAYNSLSLSEQMHYTKFESLTHGKQYYELTAENDADRKHVVSNSFVLMSHEINIPELKNELLQFYTLYTNLAPVNDNEYLQKYDDYADIEDTSSLEFNTTSFYHHWQYKLSNSNGLNVFKYISNSEKDVYNKARFRSNRKSSETLEQVLNLEIFDNCSISFSRTSPYEPPITGIEIHKEASIIENISLTIDDYLPLFRENKAGGQAIGRIKLKEPLELNQEKIKEIYNSKNYTITKEVGANNPKCINKFEVEYEETICYIKEEYLKEGSNYYKEIYHADRIYSFIGNVAGLPDSLPQITLDDQLEPIDNLVTNDCFKRRDNDDKTPAGYVKFTRYIQEKLLSREIDIKDCKVKTLIATIERNQTNTDLFESIEGIQLYDRYGQPISLLQKDDEFYIDQQDSKEFFTTNNKAMIACYLPTAEHKNDKLRYIENAYDTKNTFKVKLINFDNLDEIKNVDHAALVEQSIGYPALNARKTLRSYDVSLILDKDLFEDYKLKDKNDINNTYIYNINNHHVDLYRNSWSPDVTDKIFLPTHTKYTLESQVSHGHEYYKLTVHSIRIYFEKTNAVEEVKKEKEVVKEIKIGSLSKMYIIYNQIELSEDNKLKVTIRKDDEIEELIKLIEPSLLRVPKLDSISVISRGSGKEYACNIDVNLTLYLLTKQSLTLGDQIDTNGDTHIIQYSSKRLKHSYTKTIDENLDLSSYNTFSVLDSDDTYLKVQNTEYLIKERDVRRYKVPIFDWENDFFTRVTDPSPDDIFCDRRDIVKEVDHKNQGFLFLKRGDNFITSNELHMIYGPHPIENSRIHREMMRKIICKHPSELNKNLYDNISDKFKEKFGFTLTSLTENRLKTHAEYADIWEGNSKLSSLAESDNCLWFAHPIYFIEHLRKAKVIDEPNKFKGHTFTRTNYKEPSEGVNIPLKEFRCVDNPGFMPEEYSLTQWFNEKPSDNDEDDYRHEGVDLAVAHSKSGEIPIKALIRGKVIWTHDYGNYHYGKCVIIQASQKYNGLNRYFLLGHLHKRYIPKVGSICVPGDIVGYIGNTGHCHTSWNWSEDKQQMIQGVDYNLEGNDFLKTREHGGGAHLHLQLFLSDKEEKEFVEHLRYLTPNVLLEKYYICNPFIYNDIYWDIRGKL